MMTQRLKKALSILILLVVTSGVFLLFSRIMARKVADDFMSPGADVLQYCQITLIPTFSVKGPYHLPFWSVTYFMRDSHALWPHLPYVNVSLIGKLIDAKPIDGGLRMSHELVE